MSNRDSKGEREEVVWEEVTGGDMPLSGDTVSRTRELVLGPGSRGGPRVWGSGLG